MRQPTALEIVAFMAENRDLDNVYEAYRYWIIYHKMECPLEANRRLDEGNENHILCGCKEE